MKNTQQNIAELYKTNILTFFSKQSILRNYFPFIFGFE